MTLMNLFKADCVAGGPQEPTVVPAVVWGPEAWDQAVLDQVASALEDTEQVGGIKSQICALSIVFLLF